MTEVASSGVLRVAKPKCRDMPYMKEQDAELAHLLSIIDSLYSKASDRLAVRTRPIRLGRFLNAGVCIGLLDPVSNILANTICTSNIRPDLREKVLVGAAVERKLHDMCRRSLEGLVAFLIHFFPYLPRWEAVRYLLLAEADLLAAAHLIVADRGMAARFSLTSSASAPAFEAGLMLAAQIAEHPHPKRFVHAWMSLSSRLHHVLALVRDRGMPYYSAESSAHDNLDLLRRLLDDPVVPYLAIPWDLAASRPMCISGMANIPYQHTRSLRMVLLDTIHGFYLQAMAMLPSSELRSRLHRSLLKAGYCYGPLDPVSNIIFNTIWYEANFPAQVTPKLNLIGPKSLTRLVTRSFYGLVSFLQTCYHNLSEHQAVRCLVRTCCQLSVADPNFCAPGDDKAHCSDDHLDQFTSSPLVLTKEVQQIPSASIREGYEAAATAARHPNPKRQAMFLASRPWGMNQIKDNLCLEELQYLFNLLSPDQPPIPERICSSSWPVRIGKRRSQAQQSRISRKVEAALKRHMLRDGEPEFDLHIICCVNEDVCGPEYCDDIEDDLSFAPCKYRYTHVNFLATQKGSLFSCPILFFAEFDNEEEDGAPLSFCQVAEPTPFTEHVRCLYCEARGARVVHPTSEKFHGGGSEFEKMIRGELSLSNDFLICKNEYAVQHIYSVEEDFMYVDVA